MATLDELLQEFGVNITDKRDDETFLLLCLKRNKPDECIMRLLEMEGNIDAVNKYGKSALHIAIKRPTMIVAKELIERGADINLQDKNKFSPLHYALMKNHEAVCMLLYYGANVMLKCSLVLSPFNVALWSSAFETTKTLFNYYDDGDIYDDINYYFEHFEGAVDLLLRHSDSEFLKCIWVYFDCNLFVNLPQPFLLHFLNSYTYSRCEWFQTLQFILESDMGNELLEHVNKHLIVTQGCTFISPLLYVSYDKKQGNYDRISIIYLVLSLGIEVSITDCDNIFYLYGFEAELEAIIYAGDFLEKSDIKASAFSFVLLPYIFACTDVFCARDIVKSFRTQIEWQVVNGEGRKDDILMNALGFFSFGTDKKLKLLEIIRANSDITQTYQRTVEKLQQIPEVPSLLELSRNHTYLLIRSSCKTGTAYEFHDIVKKLRIPPLLKDIIRFKVPLY